MYKCTVYVQLVMVIDTTGNIRVIGKICYIREIKYLLHHVKVEESVHEQSRA